MDWYSEIEFFQSNTFKNISKFLRQEELEGKTVLPPRGDILNAFTFTPLDKVQVVILGQDPYPNPGFPTGIAFGVHPDISNLPRSLSNIFRELRDDIGTTRPNGDLSEWAKQGVLLLNTSLTVVEGQRNSHSKIGWSGLVREVISTLNKHKKSTVYILWGRHAQTFEMYIDETRSFIIKSAHPSPLSAARGFFGSKPFSRTNCYLENNGIIPIDW